MRLMILHFLLLMYWIRHYWFEPTVVGVFSNAKTSNKISWTSILIACFRLKIKLRSRVCYALPNLLQTRTHAILRCESVHTEPVNHSWVLHFLSRVQLNLVFSSVFHFDRRCSCVIEWSSIGRQFCWETFWFRAAVGYLCVVVFF